MDQAGAGFAFAVFRPGVNPAYAWEPVIFYGAKKRNRYEPTVRDWHSENITMRRGLPGAKPDGFSLWILDLLGVDEEDTIDDIFPGTGGVLRAWDRKKRDQEQFNLLANP